MNPSAILAGDSDRAGEAESGVYWRGALLLIAAVFALRLIYLIWLTPYELVGDEAYYWEQSRHLDLCYDEKGPALAWWIAGCCRLFGTHAWVVRLPVMMFSAVAAWGIGRLTLNVSRNNQRAAFLAVACFLLLPGFQANAQICTQDGPLIALWVALTAVGLRLFRRWEEGRNTWPDWLLLGAACGFTFLFKQTALLIGPSILLFALIRRKHLRWRPALFAQTLAALGIFILVISPMLIWNQRHGWPTIAHTAGHLAAEGDQTGYVQKGNPLSRVMLTVGGIAGAIGPACLLLMAGAIHWAHARRAADENAWRDRLWLICAALPAIGFFVILSFIKPVIPSWPLPHFVPLIAILAELVADQLHPWGSLNPRRRENPRLHGAWRTLVVYGVLGWLVLSFPTLLGTLPNIGPKFRAGLLKRLTGHEAAAETLQIALSELPQSPDGRPPVIVTRHYMEAALYAFYLPDHPTVLTAGKYLGKRSTTYDEWDNTRLDNPEFRGRTMVLEAKGDMPWSRALIFDTISPLGDGTFLVGTNYGGPRPDHPRSTGADD